MSSDAPETCPSPEMVDAWLGDSLYDFQFRPDGAPAPVGAGGDLDPVAAARRFRDVLGRFASGITVVTAVLDGEPVGMTCQSFSSVSLDPPLVLFIPSKTSRAWPQIQRSGRFCVNFLADGQAELSNTMASRGIDKFAGVGWSPAGSTGSPVLDGVLGHVDCTIHSVHEAGDHYVVTGRVLELATGAATSPLLFFQGQYDTTRG